MSSRFLSSLASPFPAKRQKVVDSLLRIAVRSLLATSLLLPAMVRAAEVKEGGANLRSACDHNSDIVVEIPAGTQLNIRYSLSGQAVPCFKVTTLVAGKTVEGYLQGSVIKGLEDFEKASHKGALVVTGVRASVPPAPIPAAAPRIYNNGSALQKQADSLIEGGRPAQALELLEPAVQTQKRRDPNLLALAGIAAWRSDDIGKALNYWNESLSIQPDGSLQSLYNRVAQEHKNDQSSQRIVGMRVMLRYEGASITVDTAREMAAVVDQEFGKIAAQLGCGGGERIVAIAQSRDAYYKSTGAAEWSGGQFDGRIHVPVFEKGALDPQTRQTLAHESVHACMAMLGDFPTWLAEGVAQKLSGEALAPAVRDQLSALGKQNKLPSLTQLGQNWGALSTEDARTAYTLSLRAVEIFDQDFSSMGLRNLLKSPERIPQITVELDRRLGM